ncbi:annexin B10-like [Macrosteles quadrilineatus]|uniref:annexin B10-like n=1 Tax=Macrosteles quadrilineatus TaxID=74068 RepID=UPI0023E3320A|nr:annexin B10-like [Macrosteles quadrilineatus]
MTHYKQEPTVVPFSAFNAVEDAVALRQAMKGFGTDEQTIIDILTKRSYNQRQEISRTYATEIERELVSDLKSEISGNFSNVIIGLMTSPVEYLCHQLQNALSGVYCDDMAVIEILCTRSCREIKDISTTYEQLFNRPLAEHVCSRTRGDFRRFLTLITTAIRNPPDHVFPKKAKEQAEALHLAGEAKWGTDEAVFNKILTHESHEQLRLVFEEYKNITGRTIKQALQSELSGSLLEAMLTVVECVQNPLPVYYAKQLHKAMAGLGTDDATLIRIIVSRCEIDLGNIKQEYERLFGKTLESDVKGDTSGDYMKALVALIGSLRDTA